MSQHIAIIEEIGSTQSEVNLTPPANPTYLRKWHKSNPIRNSEKFRDNRDELFKVTEVAAYDRI